MTLNRKNEDELVAQAQSISALTSENATLQSSIKSLQKALKDTIEKSKEAEKVHAETEAQWNDHKLSILRLLSATRNALDEKNLSWQQEKQQLMSQIRNSEGQLQSQTIGNQELFHAIAALAMGRESQDVNLEQQISALEKETQELLTDTIAAERYLELSNLEKTLLDELEAKRASILENHVKSKNAGLAKMRFLQDGVSKQKQLNSAGGKRRWTLAVAIVDSYH